MNDKHTFVQKFKEGQVFFFAGSGISFDSYMPSAQDVLSRTAEVFLEQDARYKTLKEKFLSEDWRKPSIQPEVFYENLLYVTNSLEVLSLWKSLSPHYLKSINYPVIPNINHLAIVEYSAKHKVPIFTTNFDCLFEKAAKELNYTCKVILPSPESIQDQAIQIFAENNIPDNTVFVFKLHGSVSIEEEETIETLHTTMTTISKINLAVLKFLATLCREKHITFVGYSGRDIDYFPEIKKNDFLFYPFWFDKLEDESTKKNIAYIKAKNIMAYPNEVFDEIFPHFARNTKNDREKWQGNLFDQLQISVKEKVLWTSDDARLLLGLLIKEVGEYKIAYELLLGLYRNNAFSSEKKSVLLIALSKLAHENSKYESCGYFAREALKLTRHNINLLPFSLIALCQISESRRMLIAHDTSFSFNINYLDALFAGMSFLLNGIIIQSKARKIKLASRNKVADVFAIHDSIEHKVRFWALMQAILKPLIDKKRVEFIRRHLIKKWNEIAEISRNEGYGHGIANSFRFKTRIDNIAELEQGSHIYDLTKAETGKALVFKNYAESNLNSGNLNKAKKEFYDLYDSGIKSGNILNAIKGLLGVAKCNKTANNLELLTSDEIDVLKNLMERVEGRNWRNYFDETLKEIDKRN